MVTVHPDHPLARRKSIRFEETLDYDHVGLPPSTAVYAMLNRAAAQVGRTLTYRVVAWLKRVEHEDHYDRHTDFSPFRLKL